MRCWLVHDTVGEGQYNYYKKVPMPNTVSSLNACVDQCWRFWRQNVHEVGGGGRLTFTVCSGLVNYLGTHELCFASIYFWKIVENFAK